MASSGVGAAETNVSDHAPAGDQNEEEVRDQRRSSWDWGSSYWCGGDSWAWQWGYGPYSYRNHWSWGQGPIEDSGTIPSRTTSSRE